jgi:Tol biopolymer transport system component
MPLDDVLRIAGQIAEALDAAHRAGLIHRDLKPANVMLTASGAKILDFGLAKWQSPESDAAIAAALATAPSTLTQTGMVVGTIQYMAPEQVEGKPADARSDLFALGALVYEMTTGRKAFEGTSSASVMAASLSSTPAPMTSQQPVTPPALERVVRKCLAKDPARRWQTAADLRDELAWIAEDRTAQTSTATTTVPSFASSNRWKRLAWTLTVAVTVLTLLVAALLMRSQSQPRAMTMRFSVLPPDNVTGANVPIVSPDGRKVAFVAHAADGRGLLLVRSVDSLQSQPVADADDMAFPFWSPDSKTIAFFAQGLLKRVDSAGGPAQVVCPASSARGGAWNRDGVMVFAPEAEAALYRVAASGGSPVQLTSLDKASAERSHRFPQFLEDGRHFIYSVYFAQENSGPAIHAASLDSTETQRVTGSSFARAWAPPGYLLFRRVERGPYLAQPFDHRTLRLTGDAIPVIDGVAPGSLGGDTALSASSNGVLAYETINGNPVSELTWFGRDGQRISVVGRAATYETFSLSRDSGRVAATLTYPSNTENGIWVIDLSRGVTSRVIVDETAADPVWSPDGNRIAFDSNRRGTGNWDLYSARWNGSGAAEALVISSQLKIHRNEGAGRRGGLTTNDWSHDGRFLLFTAQGGARWVNNLWILELDGNRNSRLYLETDFNKANGQFSPDSRWLAYDSDESGRSEVYVQSFPEPATRLQISTAGGTQPRWRRDGRELFYVARDGKLMVVAVRSAGEVFEADVPVALFDIPGGNSSEVGYQVGYQYDLSGDGQRFLVRNVVRPATRSPITVVLNWTAALKK